MSSSSPRCRRTVLIASAISVVAGCVLAGCSSAGPSDLDTPEVVWPEGDPAGEFEDDRAVIALREAFVERAVAWNALDFSDPDLVYRWGLPVYGAEDFADTAQRADARVADGTDDPDEWTMFGPAPMEILDVDATDGTSVVVACLRREFVQRNLATGDIEESPNSVRRFSVETFADGSTTITSIGIDDDFDDALFEQCRETDLVRGEFDPQPELFSGDGSDVKLPAPAEDYGFGNVS